MNSNKRTVYSTLIIAALVGVVSYNFLGTGTEKLQGKLSNNINAEKPGLTCSIATTKSDAGAVSVDVNIKNLGPASIDGSQPFKYAVFIDEQMVFENIDSYSMMYAGDSLDFTYPISKDIYQYSDTGTVKCTVDLDSNVSETNESNNTDIATY